MKIGQAIKEERVRRNFIMLKEKCKMINEIQNFNNIIDYNGLTRKEVINFFMTEVYVSGRSVDIIMMVSIFTAYNLSAQNYNTYFYGAARDEIAGIFSKTLAGEEFLNAEEGWNIIMETLGVEKIFHIIDNIDDYMVVYMKIINKIDSARIGALEVFTRKRKINYFEIKH